MFLRLSLSVDTVLRSLSLNVLLEQQTIQVIVLWCSGDLAFLCLSQESSALLFERLGTMEGEVISECYRVGPSLQIVAMQLHKLCMVLVKFSQSKVQEIEYVENSR